jgi:hypothetical protein
MAALKMNAEPLFGLGLSLLFSHSNRNIDEMAKKLSSN